MKRYKERRAGTKYGKRQSAEVDKIPRHSWYTIARLERTQLVTNSCTKKTSTLQLSHRTLNNLINRIDPKEKLAKENKYIRIRIWELCIVLSAR